MSLSSLKKIRWISAAWLLLILALYFNWAWKFIQNTSLLWQGKRWYCLFDDAMISMRYAWNLAHGNGLVMNPGEYVEGFTNLLMTLYMSLSTAIFDKSNAVLAIQLSGIGFVVLTGFFLALTGESLLTENARTHFRKIAPVLFVIPIIYYPLSYWSLLGMETGLLAVLVSASVWKTLRTDGSLEPSFVLSALWAAVCLTRPDASVPVAIMVLFRLTGIFKKRGWWKAALPEVGLLALCIVGVTVFRHFYYGSLVPNTFLLKVSNIPLDIRIESGLGFVAPFLVSMAFPLAFSAFSAIVNLKRNNVLVFIIVASAIVCQIYVGGDAFHYWRMLSPYVPLLILSNICEITSVASERAQSGCLFARFGNGCFFRTGEMVSILSVAALLCFSIVLNWEYRKEIAFEKDDDNLRSNRANLIAALAFKDITEKTAVAGLTWAGSIPYYSERNAVDFLGKCDKHIASLKPHIRKKAGSHGLITVPGHNKYYL